MAWLVLFWGKNSLFTSLAERLGVEDTKQFNVLKSCLECLCDCCFCAAEVAVCSVNHLDSHYLSSVAPAVVGRGHMEVKLQVPVVGA